MFEKLFVTTSDLVYHTIAPDAVQRGRFLRPCGQAGCSTAAPRRLPVLAVPAAR